MFILYLIILLNGIEFTFYITIGQKGISTTPILAFLVKKILPHDIYCNLQARQQRSVLRYLVEFIIRSPTEVTLREAAPLIKDIFVVHFILYFIHSTFTYV